MSGRNRGGLGESLEDYVETILALERAAGAARVRDIAAHFGVSKPSVTGALRALKAKGLVSYQPYAHATLTAAGRRIAAEVTRRHRVLKEFLSGVLALPNHEADAAACRMEHILAPAVIDRFCAFADFVQGCPRHAAEWVDGTGYSCVNRGADPACTHCGTLALPALQARALPAKQRRTARPTSGRHSEGRGHAQTTE